MDVQNFIRGLLPREDRFYGILARQAALAHRAALALGEYAKGTPIADVQPRIAQLEAEGDAAYGSLEDALQETFVTPIDREDLQSLADALDDVLDWTDAAARSVADFGVGQASAPMQRLAELLVQASAELEGALNALARHDYAGTHAASRTMRRVLKESESVLRAGLRDLFAEEAIDARRLLREKEVLEDLGRALDRAERVAYTLAQLSVKHG
jgi:uncharacterized protein Yka (UPF0111/DUF47 family)